MSAVLFMLSTAEAIIMRTISYDISAVLIYCVVKLNFTRLSVCLLIALAGYRPKTSHNVIIDITGALYHVAPIKIEMRSLFVQLICALFYRTNKRHIYVTPLRSSYFVSSSL